MRVVMTEHATMWPHRVAVCMCTRYTERHAWTPSAILTFCRHARQPQVVHHIRTSTIGRPPHGLIERMSVRASETPPADAH